MAENFKPLYWSKYCQTELKKDLILANWCDYQFEGEIKAGSKLKIVGAVRPTIQKYVKGKDLNIENLSDNSQYLEITESDAFAFEVDDIDEAQSVAGYLETQFDEAKTALAESADAFVGKQAAKCDKSMMSESTALADVENPLTLIDAAHVKLYKNNVSQKTELAADLIPECIVKIREKLASLFTENVEFVKRGALGKYANTYLRMSNNLYNDGTDDYMMVRTKKAIAFAGQINKMETARREKGFADIIKGLHVYGAKVVRPKELYVIRVH
ncbi:MAG: hypothetical protein IJV71_12150 [Lachnospiraceae bacterium]|nr:hypothetical protein [Lachnospiraceae bacterium]